MKLPTRLIHNRKGAPDRRTVNPPVERASTLILPDRKTLYSAETGYGRMGLTVHRELEAAMCELEGAAFAHLTPSGLSACAVAIAAFLESGDEVLLSDSVYGPTRRFCERRLKQMGVTARRFDPRDIEQLESLLSKRTKVIALEAPGSLTFEISDTPKITALARARGIVTVMDNTWAAGLFCKPLDLGVDVSVQALTKYVVGHADAFAGAIMTRDDSHAAAVASLLEDWGIAPGPEEAYAALRGTRTLATRLKTHEATGLELARWLEAQPAILRVIHPALPSHPDHALWARDFSGASGLFAILLDSSSTTELDAFLSGLKLFKLGFSWGGFESLVIPCDDQLTRLPKDWTTGHPGHLVRLHAGLEAAEDLVADLQHGLDALARTKNA